MHRRTPAWFVEAAALALGAVFAGVGCHGGSPPRGPLPHEPTTEHSNDSLIEVARRAATSDSEVLVERLRRDPFSFFRYASGPFLAATCAELAPLAADLPHVNLHGDAHLEQYAVADDGRGLADFDAATSGPFVIDLVRFATSLRITARLRGLGERAPEEAIAELLRGYRAALVDPKTTAPEPKAATRIRERFAPSPGAWLDRVEGLMAPLDDAMRAKVSDASKPFVAAMLDQNPDLAPGFFDMRRVGILKMGVGSVHEKKFLARVAGPTAAPEDDVIYEVKEVARIEPGTCVDGDPVRDPRRVIRGQARLSGVHQRFLGFVALEGRSFYVHTWRVNYTELDLADVRSASELGELAFDVGLQLGRGHPQQRWSAPDSPLRGEILSRLVDVEGRVVELARTLEARNEEAWRELVARSAPPASAAQPRSTPRAR